MKSPAPYTDTDAETARVHVDLLRQAGPQRRLALAFNLSRTVIEMSRRALRRLHPDASDEELGLLWVRQQYGAELSDALREHLARRR